MHHHAELGARNQPYCKARFALLFATAVAGCGNNHVVGDNGNDCRSTGFDPKQVLLAKPGMRSHWLRPTQGYADPWPASRMRNAAGFRANHNTPLLAQEITLWAAAGFRRARLEIPWGDSSFDNPAVFRADRIARHSNALSAMKAAGVRPQILLYGHEGGPCTYVAYEVQVTTTASKGSRILKIAPGDVAQIRPGFSGPQLSMGAGAADKGAAGVLITAVTPGGEAQLSRPLPYDLPAGKTNFVTLTYQPFGRPPNINTPGSGVRFEQTLAGFRIYVKAVVALANSILGAGGFDLEIWDRVPTAAAFLDINNYYEPDVEPADDVLYSQTTRTLLNDTLTLLATEAPGVRLVDGFANDSWLSARSTAPAALFGLGRHVTIRRQAALEFASAATALDAKGDPTGARGPDGLWVEAFTPNYNVFFPEMPLTAVTAPALWPDLVPSTGADPQGVLRGRNASGPSSVVVSSFAFLPETSDGTPLGLTPGQTWRMRTKSSLRALAAYAGAGVESLFFFAPGGDLSLLNTGLAKGGPVLAALQSFLAVFGEPNAAAATPPRGLTLTSVDNCKAPVLLMGNGTTAAPSVSARDLVAFHSFQLSNHRFVVPVWITTPDLDYVHDPGTAAADDSRFDLAVQSYGLHVAGLVGVSRVQQLDPLTGLTTTLGPVAFAQGTLRVTVPLTDTPRVLIFDEE